MSEASSAKRPAPAHAEDEGGKRAREEFAFERFMRHVGSGRIAECLSESISKFREEYLCTRSWFCEVIGPPSRTSGRASGVG